MSVPKVTSIDFFDNPLIDFPLFPYKVHGNAAFSALDSKYTWEYVETKESEELHLCKGTEEKGPLRTFTPGDDLNGAVIRLTCFPKTNGRKTKAGVDFWKETQPLAPPPVPFEEIISQERARRLKPKAPATFRMVHYNILADLLATEGTFKYSPKESLKIKYRLPMIAAELKAYNPDIISVQEIEKSHYENYLLPFLTQECGLDGRICVKLNEKPLRDGQATFFNTEKFEFLESENVVLADYIKELDFYNKLNESMKTRFDKLKHISQFSVLQTRESLGRRKLLLVCNSHIYSRPNADHVRLLQTMTILSFIHSKIAQLNKDYPKQEVVVLFSGDMNCPPQFSSVRLLNSGEIQANDMDWAPVGDPDAVEGGIPFSHNLKLRNAFPNNELTNIVSWFMECIDYIFFSESALRLVESYPPATPKELARICRVDLNALNLPNYYSPSDHVPLVADFQFKN